MDHPAGRRVESRVETAASTGSMYYDESWSLWEPPMSSDREEDHRSVLATIGQLRESLVLSARDEEAQAVAAGLRDAKAANTRRVYASAWHEFNVWALVNGRQSLPAEPQTAALYLGRLAADGRAMVTIEQARAAISHARAAEGTAKGDHPARHPVVAETVKGWRNQAPAPKQAGTLTSEALARIRETAQLVKGTPLKELDHRRGVAILGERTHLSETKRANFRSRDYQGPKTVKLETGVEECFA